MSDKAYDAGYVAGEKVAKASRWLRTKLFCKDVAVGTYMGLDENPKEVALMGGIFTAAVVVKAAGTSAAVSGLAASGPIMATGAAAVGTYMLGRGVVLATLGKKK